MTSANASGTGAGSTSGDAEGTGAGDKVNLLH